MAKLGKPRTSKGLAVLCARIAEEKLAKDIIIIDFSKVDMAPGDFFVTMACDSDIQVKAVADAIKRTCRKLGLARPRSEGEDALQWVLLDFFDVVVHVMLKKVRSYYKLEKLWGDSKFLMLNEKGNTVVYKDNLMDLYSEEDLT